MKTKIFIIALVAIFAACSTSTEIDCLDDARIIGADYRECMCCGGWFIEIESDTFRFDKLPDGSDLQIIPDDLPLDVLVEWKKRDEPCLGDEIDLIKISLK